MTASCVTAPAPRLGSKAVGWAVLGSPWFPRSLVSVLCLGCKCIYKKKQKQKAGRLLKVKGVGMGAEV